MPITNTTRAAAATLIALSLAALLASGARAGDIVTDDWFRHAGAPVAEVAPDPFEPAAAMVAAPSVESVTSLGGRVVDDWFRGPTATVAVARPLGDGLDWADFGIGAASSVAGLLLLAGLVAVALVTRRHHRAHGV